MDKIMAGKMSQKSKVVVPTALDWADLVKKIPVEKVEIDEQGKYDPKKSPEFHDWMVNG